MSSSDLTIEDFQIFLLTVFVGICLSIGSYISEIVNQIGVFIFLAYIFLILGLEARSKAKANKD